MIYRILIAAYAIMQLNTALATDSQPAPQPRGVASIAGVSIDLRSELAIAQAAAEAAQAAAEAAFNQSMKGQK